LAYAWAILRAFHHLLHQPPERPDPGFGLAAAHDPPPLHVPGRQVLQRPAPLVLVLHAAPAPRPWRQGWVGADAGLDAGLLVAADDPVERVEALVPPVALIQVEHGGGLGEEVGRAGEDPVLVLPGLDGVLVEDAPDGGAADRLIQLLLRPLGQVGGGLPAQRVAGTGDHVTGDGGDDGPVQGGKRPACALARGRPPRRNCRRPSAAASAAHSWGERRAERRLRRWTAPAVRAAATPSRRVASSAPLPSGLPPADAPGPRTPRGTRPVVWQGARHLAAPERTVSLLPTPRPATLHVFAVWTT
jgi:hypothetical protein